MIFLPEFIVKDIADVYIRENFKRLNLFFQKENIIKGQWEFFTLEFNAAVTNEKVRHGLGFKPLDVIQTSKIGAGNITFNNDKFTIDTLDITTTGAVTVRAFIGAYKEEN